MIDLGKGLRIVAFWIKNKNKSKYKIFLSPFIYTVLIISELEERTHD